MISMLKTPCFINRKSLALALVFSIPFIAEAQKQPSSIKNTISITDTIRNLNIGDDVPNIFIEKMVNDPQRSTHISTYKDALLILDFWTTGCTACIMAFPKMDSLQKQFGDKIKVLAVSYEPENRIRTFFKNNKYGKATLLPSVVEDKVLNKWFKHWAIPHEVWIYKGKIIALTNDEYVTAKNIQYVLDGNAPNWPVKNDFQKFDDSKLLLNNGNPGQVLYYAAITPFKEGVHEKEIKSTLDSVTKSRRNYFLNFTILQAYKVLWSDLVTLPLSALSPNRVILEVKDRSKYIYDSTFGTKSEWERKNQFCYESITLDRAGDVLEQKKFIIADLNRLFSLNARWEKRPIKCLILFRTSAKDKIKSKGGKLLISLDKMNKEFRNISLDELVSRLNYYEKNPPVFNDTGYNSNVDLKLTVNSWTDIPSLRKALQKYDLDLKEEQREVDVFVLSEI